MKPLLAIAASLALFPFSLWSQSLQPSKLQCEHLTQPLSIGTTSPRLSWKLEATQPGARNLTQSAYEVIASRADREEVLWSSGKVASSSSHLVEWQGSPLNSRERITWKVRVWDQDDHASPWSTPASFGIGLLTPEDWAPALWISSPSDHTFTTTEDVQNFIGDPLRGKLHLTPARYLRKEFTSRNVTRATLHATALGVYTVEINGQRVSPERLAPGWSAYQRRIHTQTYDVTTLIRKGDNAIAATLADGWFSGYVAYGLLTDQEGLVPGIAGRYYYGTSPAFRAILELEYSDGSRQTVPTDLSWRAGSGPITSTDILMGETYDARLEQKDRSTPAFDDSTWPHVVCKTGTTAKLEPHPGVPVLPIEEIPAQSVRELKPGTWIFDLGQNISGVIRLKLNATTPGQKIRIRYAEMLHQDGSLSTENLRCARSVDTYIAKGDPQGESWTPEFTYHGFQYVELSGLTSPPSQDAVTGVVIHSDTPLHSTFDSSDPMLNRLFLNMVWTQRANFFEMPTDCPQRDERMGWTGDAQIYVRAATYHADIAAFYTKWLRDLNDDQWDYGAYPAYAPRPLSRPNEHHAAGWMDAGIICPWTIWQVYGDTRVIREHWRKMNDFMAWRNTRDPMLQGADDDCGFGDWLSIGNVTTPIPFLDLAYHAYDAHLMSEMASAIGSEGEADRYRAHARKVADAFCRQYLEPDGKLRIHNQSAYAIALFFNLIPADQRQSSANHLAELVRTNNNLMTTGFLGTRPLLPVLSSHGHHDLAGILMQQRNYPSWGYEVENGATTIWERWNSYIKGKGVHEPSMNSFSHYAFGAVGEWMMSELVGIDRASVGFDHIRVAPRPTGTITHASGSTGTRHGTLACSWQKTGNTFTSTITIPPNTSATVTLPVTHRLTESGKPLTLGDGIRSIKGATVEVGSGTYQFQGSSQP